MSAWAPRLAAGRSSNAARFRPRRSKRIDGFAEHFDAEIVQEALDGRQAGGLLRVLAH